MPKNVRTPPKGYVKTSFEIAATTKYALEDIRTALRRDEGSPSGVSEAAIVETLILTAADEGVDMDVLAKVLKARTKAQDASKSAAQPETHRRR